MKDHGVRRDVKQRFRKKYGWPVLVSTGVFGVGT